MFQDPKRLKIVGFMGKAGSGKDTCCNLLQVLAREQGLKASRVGFADPLKRVCADIYCFAYDVPRKAFYGSQEEKREYQPNMGGRSGREVMQFIGTGGFRTITDDVWIAYLVKHARIMARYGVDLVIVSDVRFRNEADALRSLGATIIKVKRDQVDGPLNEGIPGHVSELEQDSIDADVEILNNGTIEELKFALRRLL